MVESSAATRRAVANIAGHEPTWATAAATVEQLSDAVAESVRLQAQLNERFAVRLLEFGSSLRAMEQTCRSIDSRVERLAAGNSERRPPARSAPTEGYAPRRFDVVHRAPALMPMSERVVLYGLVVGLRPRRCLEIGTHKGGSALIIVAALDDLGEGVLACVDPAAMISAEDWQRIAHRAILFQAASPGVLAETPRGAGGRFDFALIDGDHSTDGALRDIVGVLPILEDNACLVFHDAHNDGVSDAIILALRDAENGLTDCGMVATEKSFDAATGVCWGGLRLLRFSRRR